MPYVSDAQRKYFNANREKIGGDVVDEWNNASRGKKLPNKKKTKKSLFSLPIMKADGGGMAGMTTSSGGQGVVTVGMGSYPELRRKKKKKVVKSLPIFKGINFQEDFIENGNYNKSGNPSVNTEELAMGIDVEYEHTRDPRIAERIALDHLAEIPDYYTRLKKMEDEAKK